MRTYKNNSQEGTPNSEGLFIRCTERPYHMRVHCHNRVRLYWMKDRIYAVGATLL